MKHERETYRRGGLVFMLPIVIIILYLLVVL